MDQNIGSGTEGESSDMESPQGLQVPKPGIGQGRSVEIGGTIPRTPIAPLQEEFLKDPQPFSHALTNTTHSTAHVIRTMRLMCRYSTTYWYWAGLAIVQ